MQFPLKNFHSNCCYLFCYPQSPINLDLPPTLFPTYNSFSLPFTFPPNLQNQNIEMRVSEARREEKIGRIVGESKDAEEYGEEGEGFEKDYQLKEEKKKRENEMIKQKEGRNINSNIFKSMVKYLLSKHCSQLYLKKIISFHDMEINPEKYQKLVKTYTKNMKTYVKNHEIQAFCKGSSSDRSEEFNLITRIMVKIYLRKIHFLYSYSSKKISPQNRRLHIKFSSDLLTLFQAN